MGLLDEATANLSARRRAGRRDRLQALRHLRLPAGPDPGRGARQGVRRRHSTGSTRPWTRQRDDGARALGRLGPARAAAAEWPRHRANASARSTSPATTTPRPPANREGHRAGRRRGRRRLQAGQTVDVLLDRTPFYAESGGQAGDTGRDRGPTAAAGRVTDVPEQAGDLYVHRVELGRPAEGGRPGRAPAVDAAKRTTTRANHSAAHLLHAALHATCWARTSPRRARWSTAIACASTSATAAR